MFYRFLIRNEYRTATYHNLMRATTATSASRFVQSLTALTTTRHGRNFRTTSSVASYKVRERVLRPFIVVGRASNVAVARSSFFASLGRHRSRCASPFVPRAAFFASSTSDDDDAAAMIRAPNGGTMSDEDARELFREVGFTPPPTMSTQEAFDFLVNEARRQAEQARAGARAQRGRSAELPEPATTAAAVAVMRSFGAEVAPMKPCGVEIKGVDVAGTDDGRLPPKMAGALEVLMATYGFVLLRKQGTEQNESNVPGVYLSAEQQCRLSECFGSGALHSTHGVHPEAPCRDIFRLSNDQRHGFNSVGTEVRSTTLRPAAPHSCLEYLLRIKIIFVEAQHTSIR